MKYSIDGTENDTLFKLIGKTIERVIIVENKEKHLWKDIEDENAVSSGSSSIKITFKTTDGTIVEI